MNQKETQTHKKICYLIEHGEKDKEKLTETISLEFHISIPHVRRLIKDHIQLTYNKLKILA